MRSEKSTTKNPFLHQIWQCVERYQYVVRDNDLTIRAARSSASHGFAPVIRAYLPDRLNMPFTAMRLPITMVARSSAQLSRDRLRMTPGPHSRNPAFPSASRM